MSNQEVALENRKYEVRDTDLEKRFAVSTSYHGVRARIAGNDWEKTKGLYALLDALEVGETMLAWGHLEIARWA